MGPCSPTSRVQGTLASQWRFARDSSTVAVTGATFTRPSGESMAIPDRSLDLGCAGNNSIDDWAGRFRIRWACLPAETGEFTTRITVKNSTTVSMVDDDDTSDDAYDAAVIGSSARARSAVTSSTDRTAPATAKISTGR